MSSAHLGWYAALGVGGFQLLVNTVLLLRGLTRLPRALAQEGASERIADLLRTAWIYAVLANICLSIVLLVVASPLRAGEPVARQVTLAIGAYYVVLDVGAYGFSPGHHPGLLVFSGLGFVLLAALALSR